MSEGGAITVAAEALHKDDDPELSPGDYVLVRVRDTGAGMTPEVARPVSISSVVYRFLNALANMLLSVAIFSLGILAASLRSAAQGVTPRVRW